MSSQRTLGTFDAVEPDVDTEPVVTDALSDEHVVSADLALEEMHNPTAISLDDREQRRAVHPCKQHKHPWRSPSWLSAALDSESIEYVADVHDVEEDVIRHWAHVYGHVRDEWRNQTPALKPQIGGTD